MRPTSIQHHKGLDVARRQGREELVQQGGEDVIVASVLLVQAVVEVEAVEQTAAIDDQDTVPELDVLEELPVPLHVGG